MGLSAQELTYLRQADQRFRCRVGIFPAYSPIVTPPTLSTTAATVLAPKPMPLVTPRWSIIDNGATINLYGRDSFNRGGSYVGNANISFANTGGAGTLVDNSNGTADYTAPANGSGTNAITVSCTNANGTSTGLIYVQYPNTTNDAIVAEIASFSASVDSHGWKLLMRVRGNTSGFVNGAGIMLAVEDTWAGTTSTFGGYHYSEGVFRGYITQTEYFEDAWGETWLGCEVSSPWWILEHTKVGETWWGYNTTRIGSFYIVNFTPVDAIWHFVQTITDFSKYHNCTLFFDGNVLDDLIIDQSDLATIFGDVMGRSLATAFCDRYGSLLCIPDPDVRAEEWWGTPSPVFDSAGAGPLTEAYCQSYTITNNPFRSKKIMLESIDSSRLGLYAIAQITASALGDITKHPFKIITDSPTALAKWASQLLAKENRKWKIDVERHLDHTVDLMNFVDINFTSPSQTNGSTASGSTWVNSINYRPNVWDGGWQGSWELYKRTNGDTGGISSWGGTGQYFSGVPGWSSPGVITDWAGQVGGISSFCHIFDFQNSGAGGWIAGNSGMSTPSPLTTVGGALSISGWSGTPAASLGNPSGFSGGYVYIHRPIPIRYIHAIQFYMSATTSNNNSAHDLTIIFANGSDPVAAAFVANIGDGLVTIPLTAQTACTYVEALFRSYVVDGSPSNGIYFGGYIMSARMCGSGADPFGA